MTGIPRSPRPAVPRPPAHSDPGTPHDVVRARPPRRALTGRLPASLLLALCAGLAAAALAAPAPAVAAGCDRPAGHSVEGHGGSGRPDPLPHRRAHAPGRSCPATAPSAKPSAAGVPVLPGPSAAIEELPSEELPSAPGLPGGEAAPAVPRPRHALPQPPPAVGRPLPQDPRPTPRSRSGAADDEANEELPPAAPFSSVAASTYLPLGMGMSLIGFGVALVGLRLRRR